MPAYFISLHPGMRAAHGLHPRFRRLPDYSFATMP